MEAQTGECRLGCTRGMMTGSALSGSGLCLMNDVCFRDGSKAEGEGSLPPSGAQISSHLSQGNIQRCLEAWGIEGVVVEDYWPQGARAAVEYPCRVQHQ